MGEKEHFGAFFYTYTCICKIFFVILQPICACMSEARTHVINRRKKDKDMKIALIGYGKMGHMIEEVALSRGHEIVGIIDPTLAVSSQPSAISFDSEAFRSADVAIEFTTPATAETNVRKAWEQGVPVVCGSTGWDVNNLQFTIHNSQNFDKSSFELKEVGGQKRVYVDGKLMLIWSSNYSVGVNIFFELNKFLAEAISRQQSAISYTPSIKEIHHVHKLDKPSGTARTLAEGLRVTGYGLQDSEIESIREGEVPGTHEVTWDSEEDTIIITHVAKGRRGFALGAVLAAESLKQEKNI